MTGPRVWCLRHAQSTDNAAGLLSSVLPGAGLSDAGVQQAAAAAEELAGEPLTAVYASPALRARQTAEVLGAAAGVPVRTRAELVECGLGEFDGRPAGQVDAACLAVMRRWLVDRDLGTRMPGGESGLEVLLRFGTVMTAIAAEHRGETVAVVSHTATLTVGLMGLCPELGPEVVWGRPLPNAVPILVEHDDGTWRCAPWPAQPTADSSSSSASPE